MLMNNILDWWNNLPFCRKKKDEWSKRKRYFQDLHFPSDVFRPLGEPFWETDWVYDRNERCERYICWFFHYFTKRCTIVERTPKFVPSTSPLGVGGSHPDGRITAYLVKDDDGKTQEYIYQSNLSY